MKLSPSEQESIVALLTRIYMDICPIESEFKLLSGEGDFRPRIDYFHDAVRAFSSGDREHLEEGGRLSVEMLAYDVSCLRFLAQMPLAPFKPHGQHYSPETGLVALNETPTVQANRPDRATKERISDLYQHYAVLFAALLKTQADRDFAERADNLNKDVEEISALVDQVDSLAGGKGSIESVLNAINHIEDPKLRQLLQAFLQQKQSRDKEQLTIVSQKLKEESKRRDKEIATIEAAHMNYGLAQLGIFEESKDMVKKLASQGMNLAGKFVEASIAQTQREMGR